LARDRRTNGQTDGQLRCVKPQSRYREMRLNNEFLVRKNLLKLSLEILCVHARTDLHSAIEVITVVNPLSVCTHDFCKKASSDFDETSGVYWYLVDASIENICS